MENSEYHSHIFFLWLKNPELAIQRVKSRVQMGGHNIPEHIIRRRYHAGLHNFFKLYQPLITSWHFYDSSHSANPTLIAQGNNLKEENIYNPTLWKNIKVRYGKES